MTFIGKLWRAEAAGVAALLICAVLMSGYGFVESYLWSLKGTKLMISPLDAAWLVFSYGGIIGLVVVVFYGAPVYAFLRHKFRVSWPVVISVGAIPGVAMLPFDSVGVWLIVGGIIVASITHILCARVLINEPAL